MKYILLITLSTLFFKSQKNKVIENTNLNKIADRLIFHNFAQQNNIYQYYLNLHNPSTDSNLYFVRTNTPDTFKTILQNELKGNIFNDIMFGIFPLSDTTYIIDPYGKLNSYGIVKQDKYVFVFLKNNTKSIKEVCYQLLYINDIIYNSMGVIEKAYFMNCNGMELTYLSFKTIKK
jgi:hypothetical protein